MRKIYSKPIATTLVQKLKVELMDSTVVQPGVTEDGDNTYVDPTETGSITDLDAKKSHHNLWDTDD